ncbi:hypothetical protein ACFL9T_22360 [Thermodesulfobacteriota bacterium]
MSELTFEDLLNDPWSRRIIDDLEDKYGSPLPEELQLWIVETTGSSNMREEQQSSWINSSVAITEKLVNGKPVPAEYPLFWIRLYGILHELYPAMNSQRDIWEASFMKPIAEITPLSQHPAIPSWKKPGLRLSVKGAKFSSAILEERERKSVL